MPPPSPSELTLDSAPRPCFNESSPTLDSDMKAFCFWLCHTIDLSLLPRRLARAIWDCGVGP